MLALSEQTESLARQLAEMQKLSIDDTVRRALEKQAEAVNVVKPVASGAVTEAELAWRRAVIEDIQRQFDALPILDARPIQEIVDEVNEL